MRQDVAPELNKAKEAGDAGRAGALAASLREMGGVMGILQEDPDNKNQSPPLRQ